MTTVFLILFALVMTAVVVILSALDPVRSFGSALVRNATEVIVIVAICFAAAALTQLP
ncbi:MAG: hypothetical protein K2X52_06530 [Mycobacteriaceae bacterium]|nr:hypothetical protein [Mycobacteriaceae bacterium]